MKNKLKILLIIVFPVACWLTGLIVGLIEKYLL